MALNENPYVHGVLPAVAAAVAADGEARAKVRALVGFLGAAEDVGGVPMRKLYFDHALESGVQLRVEDIRYNVLTPNSDEDGLQRDVLFVRSDADVIYFSKRRPKADGPKGGNGEGPGRI
jgi:hypothetical protein